MSSLSERFVVSKINGQPILDWYAKQIGISKKQFVSKLLFYTQKYPLGFPDGYGNIVMRAGGVPFKKDLMYIAPFKPKTPIYLMNVADNKLIKPTDKEINEDVIKHLEKKMKPAFSFLVSCSSRRRVLNPSSYAKEIKGVSKSSGGP